VAQRRRSKPDSPGHFEDKASWLQVLEEHDCFQHVSEAHQTSPSRHAVPPFSVSSWKDYWKLLLYRRKHFQFLNSLLIFITVIIIDCSCITSCCSIDSERPHRCCHLTNKGIPYTLQWAGRCPQNCPFPSEDAGPHLMHGSLAPPESTAHKRHTTGLSIFVGLRLTLVTNIQTHTDHGTSVTMDRIVLPNNQQ